MFQLIQRGQIYADQHGWPVIIHSCTSQIVRYWRQGRSKMKETYTVRVEGVKVWVEVVNRKASYVATAMTGMRRLRSLPGQVG